jgi:hypothetical protein
MRKTITKTILITLILITSIVFVIPTANTYAEAPSGAGVKTGEVSNAPGVLSKFLAFTSLPDLLSSAAANIVNNIAVPIAGTLLSASAYILDVSIRLTLNIKSFVDATPVIYSVWKILRDITGLFFIFYLIYAAIQMMTGLGQGPSYGSTIKTIVIAGILINFSFFIVSVTIDFSNILSQTIYHAMVPNTRIMSIDSNTGISKIVSEAGKSDISNIFMNSLRIQNIYDTNGNKLGTQITDPIKILLIGTAGVIMMLTTAASFIFAALAFIARMVILLFLLAFSSLWFVASVIPQIKKYLNFWGYLWDQLIFMPIYLLLMYVGLTILNGSNLLLDVNGSINSAPTGTNWLMPYMILAVNFTIVIIILNLPLVAGLSMGGMATGWLKSNMGKWDATKVWKNFGTWTKEKGVTGAWNNTGGRFASTLAKSEGLKDFASRSKIGELTFKGIKGTAGSYDKKLAGQIKARTDFAESLGYDEKSASAIERHIRNLNEQLSQAKSRNDQSAVSMLEGRIKTQKVNLSNLKKERQGAYAERLQDTTGVAGIQTLWTKVARKDKAAAAKINIDVWQKQLDLKKADLTETRNDMKDLEKDIKADIRQNGVASAANIAEKARLQAKIDKLTSNPSHNGNIIDMGLNDLQNMIDKVKLVK